MVPWSTHLEDKANVLRKAVDGLPCYLLQVPSVYTPDEASDDIVTFLMDLLPTVIDDPAAG
jgi:hypothetical protein